MTIDKLSDNSLKIRLDTDDFKKYHIKTTDINISNVRQLLISISGEISELLNINAEKAKLFVEVFSYQTSCVIFLSNIPQEHEIKQNIICQFESFENLKYFCNTLNALYKNSVNTSRLYCNTDNIRLILKLNSDFESIFKFADEYCFAFIPDEISFGVTEEYYNKIIPENAIRKILALKN